jgi:predicted O-methyltransferase YrrM
MHCRIHELGVLPMFGMVQSYKLLSGVVGQRHALELSRAELVARIARFVAGPGWQHVQAPSLNSLMASSPCFGSIEDILGWLGVGPEAQGRLLSEFEEVSRSLDAAYSSANLAYREDMAVETTTSTALYCLIRARKPHTVVETGIANGHSSFIMLSAMARNGMGRLASVDVSHDTGGLVPIELKRRWTRIICDRRPSPALLRKHLSPFAPFDIFFHDGDHRFLGQIIDFTVGVEYLNRGGLLMSDDIDVSSAWLDASQRGLLPSRQMILLDRRKAVGFAADDWVRPVDQIEGPETFPAELWSKA